MPLTMYTTTWCGFCKNLKRQLNKAGVEAKSIGDSSGALAGV